MGNVLWLDEIREGDLPRVGRKALTLALLRHHALPVPDGFVLAAGSALDGPPRDALVAAFRRLGGPAAVRSSSTAEDLAGASFAGQYVTVLDVRDEDALLAAADRCLRSAASGAGYAAALGAVSGAMAVLVQRFVEPRAAGVVFTRDPRDATALVVESHAGRGEALVSGRVSPDRYVLDRVTLARRPGSEGASLGDADVARVVALARLAEEALGGPQDVEWAVGSEGPVLLQARPITVEEDEHPDPRVRLLTRANVGEVLPGAVTPLTWTTLGAFLEHAFGAVCDAAGLRPAEPAPFLVLFRQRLYLNLAQCAEVAARLPGVSSAQAERLILGGGATAQGVAPSPGLADLPRLAAVGLRLLRLGRRLPRAIVSAEADVAALPGREAVAAADAERLAAMLRSWAEVGRGVAATHVATSGGSAFHLAILGRVLGHLVPGDAAERVNRLVAGLDDVASASPASALEALAREAAGRPEWSSWLERTAEQTAADYREGRAPEDFARALRGFLERFGHRALSEGELREDAWEDDPTPVLAALRTLRGAPHGASFRRRARAEARRADEEAILSRLGPFRRSVVAWAVVGAQRWVRERERTKSAAVAMIHHGRRLARAAALRLVATGALARGDDVYFLTLDELAATLEARPVPAALLARRRRRFEREGALEAPREVDLAGGTAPAAPARGDGIGVSAGVGLGTARVAAEGETPALAPGEVLVAPVLDAALGPLLASAAGAVVEVGGMLSHGSVVARELGVPCVVDVREATRRIRTGDRVLVDGGSGRISVWPAGEEPFGADAPPAVVASAEAHDAGLHRLEDHPLARESVYVNVQDPEGGVTVVASLGVRPGDRGESLLAVALPDGRVLFALDLDRAPATPSSLAVGGASVAWSPFRLRFAGRAAVHEAATFPPPPLPLALGPRTAVVSLDLTLRPTTPAVDYCDGLPEEALDRLAFLGRHHVEQSGVWTGTLSVDGRALALHGTGSRDHTWGRRDWEAADHWRLFSARLGDDLAVHALTVVARGHAVEGGFVWRDGRAERITRVEYACERRDGRVTSVELGVSTAAGPPLHVHGAVVRTVTVPVQVERRLLRHLAGRPYRLLLHENYTRYEAAGRVGHGMAEITERPL